MKTFSVEEKENIEKIINSSKLCYVGMVDDKGSPYVLPMTLDTMMGSFTFILHKKESYPHTL